MPSLARAPARGRFASGEKCLTWSYDDGVGQRSTVIVPSRVSPAASEPFAVSALRSEEPTNGAKFCVRGGSFTVVPHLRISDGGASSTSIGIGPGRGSAPAAAGADIATTSAAATARAALPPMRPMVLHRSREYHHLLARYLRRARSSAFSRCSSASRSDSASIPFSRPRRRDRSRRSCARNSASCRALAAGSDAAVAEAITGPVGSSSESKSWRVGYPIA